MLRNQSAMTAFRMFGWILAITLLSLPETLFAQDVFSGGGGAGSSGSRSPLLKGSVVTQRDLDKEAKILQEDERHQQELDQIDVAIDAENQRHDIVENTNIPSMSQPGLRPAAESAEKRRHPEVLKRLEDRRKIEDKLHAMNVAKIESFYGSAASTGGDDANDSAPPSQLPGGSQDGQSQSSAPRQNNPSPNRPGAGQSGTVPPPAQIPLTPGGGGNVEPGSSNNPPSGSGGPSGSEDPSNGLQNPGSGGNEIGTLPGENPRPLNGGAESTAPNDPNDTQSLQRLGAQLQQMLDDGRKNTLAATDEFFSSATEAVIKNIEFLAQEPGVPARLIGGAILDYLTNDNSANHDMLYKEAAKAADEFKKNPAGFLGTQVGNQAFAAALGGIGNVAGSAVKGVASRVAAIAKVEKAATSLLRVNAAANEFGEFVEQSAASRKVGSAGSGGGYGNGQAAPAPLPGQPANPTTILCAGLDNVCVPVAIARAKTWLTGRPVVAAPHYQPPNATMPKVPEFGTPMGRGEIEKILDREFSSRPSPELPEWRARVQEEGIPTPMTKNEIVDELKAAPDGAQGLVFVRQNPNGIGHVFNAGKINGKVIFQDDTGGLSAPYDAPIQSPEYGMNPGFMLDENPFRIYFFRVQ